MNIKTKRVVAGLEAQNDQVMALLLSADLNAESGGSVPPIVRVLRSEIMARPGELHGRGLRPDQLLWDVQYHLVASADEGAIKHIHDGELGRTRRLDPMQRLRKPAPEDEFLFDGSQYPPDTNDLTEDDFDGITGDLDPTHPSHDS